MGNKKMTIKFLI